MVIQKRLTNNPKNPTTEIQDYAITIDMAKEISMIQRNEIGKKFRQYFIECEKELKETQQYKLPSTYKEALLQLVEQVEENEKLQLENTSLNIENRLLNKEEFAWADTNLINALVRKYGSSTGEFGKAWTDFKKNLLYKYGININSRITNYLNNTGKKTKPKTLSMLKTQDEISSGIATIISMCKENNIEIQEIINHAKEN